MLKSDVQNGAARQVGTIMKEMPKKRAQTKVNQESQQMVGWGKGRVFPRGGPSLGVVADDSNDELLCHRAKNIRESCRTERAGNSEHSQLFHDWLLCARARRLDGSISL